MLKSPSLAVQCFTSKIFGNTGVALQYTANISSKYKPIKCTPPVGYHIDDISCVSISYIVESWNLLNKNWKISLGNVCIGDNSGGTSHMFFFLCTLTQSITVTNLYGACTTSAFCMISDLLLTGFLAVISMTTVAEKLKHTRLVSNLRNHHCFDNIQRPFPVARLRHTDPLSTAPPFKILQWSPPSNTYYSGPYELESLSKATLTNYSKLPNPRSPFAWHPQISPLWILLCYVSISQIDSLVQNTLLIIPFASKVYCALASNGVIHLPKRWAQIFCPYIFSFVLCSRAGCPSNKGPWRHALLRFHYFIFPLLSSSSSSSFAFSLNHISIYEAGQNIWL